MRLQDRLCSNITAKQAKKEEIEDVEICFRTCSIHLITRCSWKRWRGDFVRYDSYEIVKSCACSYLYSLEAYSICGPPVAFVSESLSRSLSLSETAPISFYELKSFKESKR